MPNIITDFYRDSGLLFWIYCICTSKTGENLPVKGKEIKKIPKELEPMLRQDPDALKVVLDAMGKGGVWWFRIEGKGWTPRERNGARDVAAVQSTLEWLQRFDQHATVDGSKLLFAMIETSTDV